MDHLMNRRELLRAGAAGGAPLGAPGLAYNSLIERALASAPTAARPDSVHSTSPESTRLSLRYRNRRYWTLGCS